MKRITGEKVRVITTVGQHGAMGGAVHGPTQYIFAGSYCDPANEAELVAIRNNKITRKRIKPHGRRLESIFDFCDFDENHLLMSLESGGGSPGELHTLNVHTLETNFLTTLAVGRVHSGAFHAQVLDGDPTVVGGGEFWSRRHGKTPNWKNTRLYLKGAFYFGGQRYIYGYDLDRDQGGWLADLPGWPWQSLGAKMRPMFAAVRPDGKVLGVPLIRNFSMDTYAGLASYCIIKNGQHHHCRKHWPEYKTTPSGLWVDNRDFLIGYSDKWRGSGSSAIVRHSGDLNNPEIIFKCDEAEMRAIRILKDVGVVLFTREENKGGKIYLL